MFPFRSYIVSALALMLLTGCGGDTLHNYQADSPEEAAVQAALNHLQDAMNARDARAAEVVLHQDLKAMIGNNRRIVSKRQYMETFARRMSGRPVTVFGPPKVSFVGDRASVKLTKRTGSVETLLTFELIRENGQWLILSWRY